MSLSCPVGPEANILEPGENQCRRLHLPQPILSLHDMKTIGATQVQNWKVSSTSRRISCRNPCPILPQPLRCFGIFRAICKRLGNVAIGCLANP